VISARDGSGVAGGFDTVLGNPPWDRVNIEEKEWFAVRHTTIAAAPTGAARKAMILELPRSNPTLWQEYLNAARKTDSTAALLNRSARFPLCARGRLNTFALFAELNTLIT